MKTASDALKDYILNGRPDSEYTEIFLRISPPYYAIQDASSIGDMFRRYQKKAGITRRLLMEKGFMVCADDWQKNCWYQVLRQHLSHRSLDTMIYIQSVSIFRLILQI